MPSIAQTAAYTSTASASNYNTGSQSIGSSNTGKTIFALISARGGASSISACTIGGVAATQVIVTAATTAHCLAAIYKVRAADLADPSVTTLAVDITFNASVTRGLVCAIAITDDAIATTAYDTATAADDTQDETQQTVNVSLDVPSNGFTLGIGGCYCEASGSSWTGITQGTEYQVSPTSAETYIRPGYASSMAAEAPRSVTYVSGVSAVGDVGATAAVCASFGLTTQDIAAAHFDDSTDVFPTATVGLNVATPPLTNAQTFWTAAVTTVQTIIATLLTNTQTFGTAAIGGEALSFEQDFIGYLLADAPLKTLVGTRIYPVSRPQGSALPAVTSTTISGAPEYADDGDTGLISNRVQIDCWADTYTTVKGITDAVKLRLSGKRDVTHGAETFLYIMLDNEHDLREGGSGEPEYLFRTVLDFITWR